MGSWGSGNWEMPEETENETLNQLLEKLKDNDDLSLDIEWDQELSGDYKIKLQWGMQLLPQAPGKTKVIMQSGLIGIFGKKHGLGKFIEKLKILQELLKDYTKSDFDKACEPVHACFVSAAGS